MRALLNIEGTFELSDAMTAQYFPDALGERLGKSLQPLPESDDDKRVIAEVIGEIVDDWYFDAFRSAARIPLSVFPSGAPFIDQFVRSWKHDYADFYRAIGQWIALRLIADRIRRDFDIADEWPAEKALLCGTNAVPVPTVGKAKVFKKGKSLAEVIGAPLFGNIAIPLDDPRSVQAMRDMGHSMIEKAMKQHAHLLKRQEIYFKDDAGNFVKVADPEVALYQSIQNELPETIRQPLPKTAIPHRVMTQRFADARKRQAKMIPTITGAMSRRQRRKARKDE